MTQRLTTRLNVPITPDELERFTAYCKRHQLNRSEVVRQLIIDFLVDKE